MPESSNAASFRLSSTERVHSAQIKGASCMSATKEDVACDKCTSGIGIELETQNHDTMACSGKVHRAFADTPMVGIEHRHAYRFVKRAFDICFSSAVLVCLGWFFLAVAAAIKLDDPKGPVFFCQDRVGKDGKTFRMIKFRSMVANAEDLLDDLQDLNEKDGPVFKIADDPRITRVGRFIRKTSIDELPQFINVFIGDMSVVGPRPALPKEVAQYDDYQRQRLLMKPGITCYWQTRRNRDAITFDEWIDLDLLYIKNCSVWADFKLIIQTVGVVLTAQGS